ncbi:ADP-ribosylglycohydrolase family protein [Vagococcus fluvialis]|uniref:ADP-ribosylglycohydrolase family protein n=1 Tax=Vagococcus fluvialis TaxID=2738 RepID=A0A7X6I458_9ENTE|nr:ADP-ribosylglycohydrolase family protein [Vagococcus fluvialis]NKC69156.1 ADP-ribosylglycohydrolase family protein [Vagococcus fluvialis]
MNNYLDKTLGVLYGVAYGDALGATIEKLTYEEIQQNHGLVDTIHRDWYKAKWPKENRNNRMRGNGIITDDTLMMMALLETYFDLERHLDAYDMGKSFVDKIVYQKRFIPELDKIGVIQDRLFYPEQYIFLRHVLANCEPREGGYGNMINCGAAMYIAPVGIINAGNPRGAYEEAIAFCSGHQASYGLEAAGVLAACVAEGFGYQADIESVVNVALKYAKDGTKMAIKDIVDLAVELRPIKNDRKEIVRRFHQCLNMYSPMGDDVHRKREKLGVPSNHYTPSRIFSIEELPMALAYLVLHEGDAKKAIIDGVNSGRDTDSIGVMIGAISGALDGNTLVSYADRQTLRTVNQMDFERYGEKIIEIGSKLLNEEISLQTSRLKIMKEVDN